MRENSFYVDTVRAFRDRRYEYKVPRHNDVINTFFFLLTFFWQNSLKVAQAALREALKENNPVLIEDAQKKIVLCDSLQMAHKCILNSFYG